MKIQYKIINNYKQQKIPTLIFSFNNKNYIFNTSHGYQRFLKEYNEKLKKDSSYFYTNSNSENFIGLIGTLCSIIEHETGDNVYFFLDKTIYNFLFSLKYIFFFKYLFFSFFNLDEKISSEGIYFKKLKNIISKGFNAIEYFNDFSKFYKNLKKGDKFDAKNLIFLNSNFIPNNLINDEISIFKDNNLEIIIIPLSNNTKCYILITNKVENKIDKDLIKKYDLTGKEMKEIINKKFLIKNDLKIELKDITEKPQNSEVYIILEANNENDINILKNNKIYQYLLINNNIFNLKNIYHLTNIIDNEFYINFIKENIDFNHILCNSEYENSKVLSNYFKCDKFLNSLNYYFNEFFPLYENKENLEIINKLSEIKNISFNKREDNIINVEKKTISIFENLKPIKNIFEFNYPFFNILGTGSMIPSTYRNVSSILIGINKNCNLLLDCGEGTSLQIYKQYGDLADNIILNIKIILISHAHFDHNLGILEILRVKDELFKKYNKETEEIYIICPYNLLKLLFNYEKFINKSKVNYITTLDLLNYNDNEILDNLKKNCKPSGHFLNYYYNYEEILNLYKKEKINYFNKFNEFCRDFKINKIIPIENYHCPESVSFVLEIENYKICFSGDTRPNKNFSKIGINADILFHEATLEDNMTKDAIKKEHSTFIEAINIGREMKSKYICLTHFSQRYTYSEKYKNYKNRLKINYPDKNLIFGWDFMNFNFKNIDNLIEINKDINKGIFNFDLKE